MAMRYPAARRLRAASEFSRVRAQGASFPAKFVVINVLKLGEGAPWRCGIITSRKVGGAVERNLVRRRLREIIRAANLREGLWIVIIARWRAADASFIELREDWMRAALRAHILEDQPAKANA